MTGHDLPPGTGFRALALDLDGTLLGPDHAVSARNQAAVAAAVEAGWHVVLATARWYQLAERTAVSLGLVDPVIACSGAEVRRLTDGADLLDVRLPAAFAAEVLQRCDEHGGTALVYQDADVLIRSDSPPSPFDAPEVRRVPALSGVAEPEPRCVLLFGVEVTEAVMADLEPAWRDEVRFLTSMAGGGRGVLTLTSSRADKGLALHVACAELGIEPEAVVAMGDSETDVEMFKVAGASVAMGQAGEDVKAAATWVTAPNDEDGVGIAIEDLLAGRLTR